MALGIPQSRKFQIGTAELRVGALTSAMKLLQANSVGLVDSVNITVGQESVDLEGLFPKVLVDSAIVRQTVQIAGVLREYSRRNLKLAVGEGVGTAVTDVESAVEGSAAAAATVFSVEAGDGADFTAGDLIVSYKTNAPETVQVLRVASIATDAITLDADTPLLFALADGDPVFIAHQIAIGAVSRTNYFTGMVVQKENATGRPLVWHFWKCSISGNLDYATDSSNFASTTVTLKALTPTSDDYESGGDLFHLADIIPSHPIGIFAGGGGS